MNPVSSNFNPQVKQARNLSQTFYRKSISRNTTHRQSIHLIQSESRCRGCAYKIKTEQDHPVKREKKCHKRTNQFITCNTIAAGVFKLNEGQDFHVSHQSNALRTNLLTNRHKWYQLCYCQGEKITFISLFTEAMGFQHMLCFVLLRWNLGPTTTKNSEQLERQHLKLSE